MPVQTRSLVKNRLEKVRAAKKKRERENQTQLKNIRKLYYSGKPLFTKALLSDVATQLRALDGKPGTISIMGFEGKMTEQSVSTGLSIASAHENENIECYRGDPKIHYQCIQTINRYHQDFGPISAAVNINHPLAYRNKNTQEIIDQLFVWRRDADTLQKPITEAEMRDNFEEGKKLWSQEKQCTDLKAIVNSLDLRKVDKIVGFAFSSLRTDLILPKIDYPHRSTFQHALLIMLADMISKKRKSPVLCYAQDPIYNEFDKKILQQHGITVVNDPDGFLMVDEKTLVLSFAPNVCVKQIIADIAKPIAMIWNTVLDEDKDESLPKTDSDSSRVRDFTAKYYRKIDIPLKTENFSDVSLYVRDDV